MSKKQSCVEHINAIIDDCNARIKAYDERAKQCTTKEMRKALRKETRIARIKRNMKQCVAMRELLACITSEVSLDNASNACKYLLAITNDVIAREQFIICKDDDLMSLLMRYDNFSMKKVLKYCEKHNIIFDMKSKTFDFSKCDDDVLDTFDDDSDSDD